MRKPPFDGEVVRLGELVESSKAKNKDGLFADVYSVTNSHGFVPSQEYFNKEVYSKELRTYRVVHRNMIAYNPSRINVGSVAVQDKVDNAIVSPLYVVFSTDETKVMPSYLVRFLRSKPGLDQIAQQSIGTVRNNLKFDALCKMQMPLPSLQVQVERMNKLTLIEQLADGCRNYLFNLDELVKSRFVEMFDDTSWPVVRASDVMTSFRNGISPSKNGSIHEKVLTLSAITQGYFDGGAWKDGSFNEVPASDKRVSGTDFFICRGNGNSHLVGTGEFADGSHPDLIFPDTMIAGTVNENMVRKSFLTQAWKQPSVRQQIETKARTTNGTLKINQKIVSEIRFPLPPLDAQDKFASFVEQVDKLRFAFIRLSESLVLVGSRDAALSSSVIAAVNPMCRYGRQRIYALVPKSFYSSIP